MRTYSLADLLGATQQLQPKSIYRSKVRSARSQNRAAAHAYDLVQWREYRVAMARSDEERDAIEAEYAERLEAGPSFVSYHAGSDFSEPHRHELNKEGMRKMLAAFDAVQAWQWERQRKHRGQAVSLRYKAVLKVLLSFAVRYGQVFPKLETIARMVKCSKTTVVNALRWLKVWGFLDWQRRLKRVVTRLGTMVRQTSNAYRLALSGLAAIGVAILPPRLRVQPLNSIPIKGLTPRFETSPG
jgi:hypothetical protein